jgi:hypothetical protein
LRYGNPSRFGFAEAARQDSTSSYPLRSALQAEPLSDKSDRLLGESTWK